MSSPASIKKHPLHPMLVGFPIGLWVFALVCDIIAATGAAGPWRTVAFYSIVGGTVGAVLAAVPGLIDYLSIHEADMKRIATFHLVANVCALLLFAVNLWCRLTLPPTSAMPLALSIIGVGGIGIGGWLGGEMVYVKGMAVEAVEKSAHKVEEQPRLRRVG